MAVGEEEAINLGSTKPQFTTKSGKLALNIPYIYPIFSI